MKNITLRELFLTHVAQTSPFPLALEIEKAEGIYLYDSSGKRYTDLISGISVSTIGHRHPAVVEAIENQLKKYMHLMVYGEYIQTPQVQLATLLAQHLPENLSSVYFTNSGAEATEGALKLAKRYTGRTEIISCHRSYHGSTHGALSVMGNEFFKQAYRPLLPDVKFIHYGSWSDLDFITERTACVIMETIQAEAGVISACKEYFKLLRQKCNQTGTLLILDEIQTGFGRTGTLWAFEPMGIVPDIVLLAKAMGGGMPIGAFVSSANIMQVFQSHPILGHITTFGGHPVCCAAAWANLNVLLKTEIWKTVPHKESLFKKYLKHPAIQSIRSNGLLMAVQFENFSVLKKIIDKCIENGVITDWFLHCDNSMRIAPPLVITDEQILQAAHTIIECVEQVCG